MQKTLLILFHLKNVSINEKNKIKTPKQRANFDVKKVHYDCSQCRYTIESKLFEGR